MLVIVSVLVLVQASGSGGGRSGATTIRTSSMWSRVETVVEVAKVLALAVAVILAVVERGCC